MKGTKEMKKNIKKTMLGLFALPVFVLGLSVVSATFQPVDVNAQGTDLSIGRGANEAKSEDQQESLDGDTGVFAVITQVLLFLVGAISVIMLVVGGIRYVVSGGDSSAVQSAKSTILYAIVGIIISLIAFAVVRFVISNLSANGGGV